MPNLVRRPLADKVLSTPGAVVIVEGARAVGKSTMARNQLSDHTYVTFADPTVRADADADPAGWLRRQPSPLVIDEAQLVPSLPLALKEHVDASSGRRIVLTGSASIGRTGLGGADPLTRRATRLTMAPLTRWELKGLRGSTVELLFDGVPRVGARAAHDDRQLLESLRVGGFPNYVFPGRILTRDQLRRRLRTDTTAVLSDRIAPELDFNVARARDLLDVLLRMPGGILNVTGLGNRLDLDRRTVDRYLDIFGRLFLIHRLPNLGAAPRRQGLAHAKAHPVDVALAVDALERAGADLLESREHWGQILETHVVNELAAASQWANIGVDLFYWRDSSGIVPEVDLVLRDDTGRHVAVEVKAASQVDRRADLRGIRAFEQHRNLHRGFVFYGGETVIQLDDRIWALPLSALEDDRVFEEADAGPNHPGEARSRYIMQSASDHDGTLFLSYVHADDQALGGAIVEFVRDVVGTYAFLYGRDLELFVDRDDIRWGENWADRLDRQIDETTFMVAAVTPRYLRSDACRGEVLSFSAAAVESGEPRLLLPLLWATVEGTDVVEPHDPVLTRILASQYVDVQVARTLEHGSVAYQRLVESVAVRLRQTIVARTAPAPSSQDGDDELDFAELQERLEQSRVELEGGMSRFRAALEGVSEAFGVEPIPTGVDSNSARSALERLGSRLEVPSRDLEAATADLAIAWGGVDQTVGLMVTMMAMLPDDARNGVREDLAGMQQAVLIPGLDEMETILPMLSAVSRRLRPASRALSSSIRLVRGIQDSVAAWRHRLDA